MQTLEKPKTTKSWLTDQHKRAMKGVATKPVIAKGPKTLDEAKARLAELQRACAKLGIQLPSVEIPKTLDRAKSMIREVEQQLASGGAKSSVPSSQATPPPPSPKPASPPAPNTSRLAAPPVSQSRDPRDMTRSELEAGIKSAQKAKDFERVGVLYRQLQVRRAGEPTRGVIEKTANMTISELEAAIAAEKNEEQRGMLYRQLCQRRKAGNRI